MSFFLTRVSRFRDLLSMFKFAVESLTLKLALPASMCGIVLIVVVKECL